MDEESSASTCMSVTYDWDDPCWDHQFGMEKSSARDQYSNRGRTQAVWKTLTAYGFRRSTNGSNSFEGDFNPNPCFEYLVRKSVKYAGKGQSRILENGEVKDYSIEKLACEIRCNFHIDYLDVPTKTSIKNMNDIDLVKQALSTKGIGYGDLFYSFCRENLEQGSCTWHCRICKACKDWRDWHCKGCNKCQYGASIPCSTCSPREYEIWELQNC